MTVISRQLWDYWMDDAIMPADCTYEQFLVARDMAWAEDSRDNAFASMKALKVLKERQTDPAIIDLIDDRIVVEAERLT